MKYATNKTSQNYLADAFFFNDFLSVRNTKKTHQSFQKHSTQQYKNKHTVSESYFLYPISSNPQKQLQGSIK